jgi:hypothetical protein
LHPVSVQEPDAVHAPVPLLNAAAQSMQDDPQQLFVSITHVMPLAWYPLAQVKTHTSPLHDGVPLPTAAQSTALAQAAPGGHFRVQLPPQSTAVSSPSLMRSEQDAAQRPLVQSPLMQSAPLPHAAAKPHLAGQLPPQSTPVSSPSRTAFEHALATQAPLTQIPLAQSAAPAHWTPFGHFRGQAPPQSTPVSSPLRTSSPQLACRQIPRMQDSAPAHGLFDSSQMDPGGAPHAISSSEAIQSSVMRRVLMLVRRRNTGRCPPPP